jgi:hypothetical protein
VVCSGEGVEYIMLRDFLASFLTSENRELLLKHADEEFFQQQTPLLKENFSEDVIIIAYLTGVCVCVCVRARMCVCVCTCVHNIEHSYNLYA